MRNSELLRFKIELASGELAHNLDRLWHSGDPGRVFPAFILLLQQIIRASVPLMQEAHAVALGHGDDPVCRPLAAYVAEHIEEERDHDEWTLQDLDAAGFPRADVLAQIPSPNVAATVGAQYYWIRHHHPVGLLGYITVLEGSPITGDQLEDLRERTGLPEELFRTYRMHGELDPHHRQELADFLDSLPLAPGQVSLIGISAMNTVLGLSRCVADVLGAPPLPDPGPRRPRAGVSELAPRVSQTREGRGAATPVPR